MSTLYQINFVSGAISMGYLILGVFFLKFWRRTRDSFFVLFAFAFWLLAVNQAAFAGFGNAGPGEGWIYLFRLGAFLLIIIAIVRKNMRITPPR
jgi:hypothetical protein